MSEQIIPTAPILPAWNSLMAPLVRPAARRRVLLVTPYREQARVLGGLLWLGGFEAVGAPDVTSALAIAAHTRPDAAVLDTTLARREAQTLCALLRRWRRAAPIVALSACPDPAEEAAWLRLGVDACCAALLAPAAIVPTIEGLLAGTRPAVCPALLPALLGALETHAPDTAEHARRTADLAVALGRQLGLDRAALVDLHIGALLHDIGKLSVPRAVLQKPGALDAVQRAAINGHPLVGLHILAPTQLPAGALAVVRSHHERWDGAGYPARQGGAAIPLGARITAVADAFDAMTSHRSYRPAMTPAAALASIRAGAGSHYDPAVVTALSDFVAGLLPPDRCAA